MLAGWGWRIAWSVLAVTLLAGVAQAQDAPGPAHEGAATAGAWMGSGTERVQGEFGFGYSYSWPELCRVPTAQTHSNGQVDMLDSRGVLPAYEIPQCAQFLDARGLHHAFLASEGRLGSGSLLSLGPSEARAGEAEGDAAVLESAGEAWAHPGRGRFRAEAAVQVDTLAAHAEVALVPVAEPAPAEPAEQVLPAAFQSAPPPVFPAYAPVPVWEEPASSEPALDPLRVEGIRHERVEATPLQSAAQKVRMGIARVGIEVDQAVVAGLLLVLAGVALYQRFTPARSIQHETRAQIHQLLTARPEGVTASEIGRLLDLNRKTAEYHLTYLARLGTVRTGLDESGTRLYSLKAIPARRTLVERLLLLVRQKPGLSIPEAATLLDVSRSSADRHAKALVIQGSLESRLVDGERRLFERFG